LIGYILSSFGLTHLPEQWQDLKTPAARERDNVDTEIVEPPHCVLENKTV
jgi:hypothetical protein